MKRHSAHLFSPCITGLVLLLIFGCKQSGKDLEKFGTATVSRGRIVQHVTASGTLDAVGSVDVGSQVSGKIITLYADYNSPVNKGQLVAEIDPTRYGAALCQAEGQLASAQADVTLKRQNLERKRVLVPLRAASQLDLDEAVAELVKAEAMVTIRQAALESAKADLSYCKITAPIDGIVIARKVDVGQTVNAAMNTPVLFTIAQDITHMNIEASISEADIGLVKAGQSVEFTVDAFPDDVFTGEVTQVRKSPITQQNVVTYETIITVDNPEQKLFPGMTANVSILVADHNDVLKVPNVALRYTPPKEVKYEQLSSTNLERNQRMIYSPGSDREKLKPIIVEIGITDGVDTEIRTGSAEGTAIVTSTRASKKKKGGSDSSKQP